MEFFVLLFILLCVWCLIPRKGGVNNRFYTKNFFKNSGINEKEYEYLDFKTNNCLRGIFSIAILFGHYWKSFYMHYIKMNGYLADFIFSVGAAGVGIFYILSSYGTVRSYTKASINGSGMKYVKKFFTRKIPLLLMFFITANLIYVLYDILWAGGNYSIWEFLFKVTSIDVYWTGAFTVMINRYTWFVFVLIHIYILLGFAFFVAEKIKSIPHEKKALVVAASVAIVLFVIQQSGRSIAGVGSNPIFVKELNCFSFGLFYGIYHRQINAWFHRWWWQLFSLFLLVSLLDLFLPGRLFESLEYRHFFACLFVILVITKVNIKNAIAEYLGVLSFGIYFMQLLAINIVNDHITDPVDIRFGLYATIIVLALAYVFMSVKFFYKKLFNKKPEKIKPELIEGKNQNLLTYK